MRKWVKTFKPEFAPMVLNRTKSSTIRPFPTDCVIPEIGDTLDARMWEGKAYRSTQIKLACFRIVRVSHIWITRNSISVPPATEYAPLGVPLPPSIAEAWAKMDGFQSASDMYAWFGQNYKLPFFGIRIEWDPK